MRKKKDKYHYLVSYYCKRGYDSGIGNTEIVTNGVVNNINMIRDIEKGIKDAFKMKHVVLINYILIGVNLENEKSSNSCENDKS